ncbi:hypothetical protein EHEL_020500 [Encephalitozoon hellem ATCC 50504]|uniref:Uncharacterized protein n=1 Tax=Encephalitozoon hellem TaxID=27973 RepID=A0A9Q9F8Z5_ENCHE|nr:uncharacterized protein EHEL_020500 [Encephalitozoon hellem ATCC 50504]AFM97806.1 hypothetical protein EHEL_020500 [Encephalitozoon hellem ATCC 50504]UTX42577.1 hypothetical protein GPU96_02g02890 [Encephalitozoon hellem]|eukprot:XP_003886787.1 hypothetical protein EHEL_020500 [Encephalitozoon hellem ATCC 50504]
MLRALFGYEKHFQMVDDVYKTGTMGEEKLSRLITYLKSKTSTVPSTLDYLRARAREEVQVTHRLKTGSRVLRQIIDQLRGVSICYESRMIRIFAGVIQEILQLKKDGNFEYSDHQEFLDVFIHFFKTVPIRAYESERYIQKILFIATKAAGGLATIEYGMSDDNYVENTGRRMHSGASGSSDDVGGRYSPKRSICEGRGEISNARFEYFFLEVIHTLMEVEDILRIYYDEKYKWLVGSLMKHGEVNSAKRTEIFRLVARKANIISGNSLIYHMLKHASWIKKSCVGILTEYLESNLYPQIILQVNMNILERGGRLCRKEGSDNSSVVKECEFLVGEATGVLKRYDVMHLNQKEIVLSFFSIFEMFFSQEDGEFLFIIPYIREYFEKCKPISDIFYRFLKKIFQERKPNKYTRNLKVTMFGEIQRYFVVHSNCVPSTRFITLLLNYTGDESMSFCCKILYLTKDYFMARTLKPFIKERVMGRLRVLFHETDNKDILYLLMDLVEHDISRDDHYKILCLLNTRKVLNEQLVRELYKGRYSSIEEALFSEFGCEVLEPYDLELDKRMYEGGSGGSKGCENEVCGEKPLRCTRIALIDYEKHFR